MYERRPIKQPNTTHPYSVAVCVVFLRGWYILFSQKCHRYNTSAFYRRVQQGSSGPSAIFLLINKCLATLAISRGDYRVTAS